MSDTETNFGDVSEYPAPLEGTPRLISFLRTALNNPEHDELFQEVLNLGYNEWQRRENWGFGDMVEWVEEQFGEEAALIVMLGKFNQQVENGGVIQWLDNGYASSSKERGRGWRTISPEMDISLLEDMISKLTDSPLAKSHLGQNVLQILKRIYAEFEDADANCDYCHNHRYVNCETCGGTGKAEDETCDACDGEGEVDGETCENCGGTGSVSSNDGECEECHGEGELPCEDCNREGQLEMDSKESDWYPDTDALDKYYYSFNKKWEAEVEEYLKKLVRGSEGGGLLSRAQAFKATEKILNMLNRLIESLEKLES